MEDKDTIQAFRITYLLSRNITDELTADEQEEVELWLTAKPENKQLLTDLMDQGYRDHILSTWNPKAAERSLSNIKVKMRAAKKHRLWSAIVAAASIVLISTAGIYFYTSHHPIVNYQSQVLQHDIAPGKNTATLTLSDGSKFVLSNALNGKLAEQAGVVISKTADGQVVYKAKAIGNNHEIKYNTLSTAKGETYQIELPDGTKVWLNAATTLKFPSTFAASANRKVELTGEAYFEVAKDKKRLFIVHSDDQDVEVLGTHFNISSYTDEGSVKTTLLEGAVRVHSQKIVNRQSNTVNLLPGQQSILSSNTIKIQAANVEETMAWKNGYFKFNDENLESIMRKLERWYDVEVVYDGLFENEGFSGKISRARNISKVLKILESTKTVHFKIEGRRITVSK